MKKKKLHFEVGNYLDNGILHFFGREMFRQDWQKREAVREEMQKPVFVLVKSVSEPF